MMEAMRLQVQNGNGLGIIAFECMVIDLAADTNLICVSACTGHTGMFLILFL
jgi:hypothetical protein